MNETLKLLQALAETYGIVEDFLGPNVRKKVSSDAVPKQNFYQYLIVIDFESTCWEKSEVKWHRPEIIGSLFGQPTKPSFQTFFFQSFRQFWSV